MLLGSKYQINARHKFTRKQLVKLSFSICNRGVSKNFLAPVKRLVIVGVSEPQQQVQDGGDIPEELRDPITLELMRDPVRLQETGDVYERESLVAWLNRHSTCPKTLAPLNNRQYVPDENLRERCNQYARVNANGNATHPTPTYTDLIHVFVRGLSQKTHTIQAHPNDSIQTLKAKISDKVGLPPREFNVNFNGRQLSTGTLQSNSIVDESNLVMTVNYQGGSYIMI